MSVFKFAGAAAVISVLAGLFGLACPAVANAQTNPSARVQNCGLSQGLVHWAYTNCGNSPALVRFLHQPLHGPEFTRTQCIGKGQVVSVGQAALEKVSATELQGPCKP